MTHVYIHPAITMRLQEVFKAVKQFVKDIQAGGPVQKGADAQPQADKPTAKTAVNVTSTSNTAPPQVLHLASKLQRPKLNVQSLTSRLCHAQAAPCTSAA